ncbi:MAG: hypothetical protein MAGBODY4_01627 [Candidatus Marinimicrobia bacterium]|nr:hypothetical protein [Candidatus Neomarinimicrobiota bacterium]
MYFPVDPFHETDLYSIISICYYMFNELAIFRSKEKKPLDIAFSRTQPRTIPPQNRHCTSTISSMGYPFSLRRISLIRFSIDGCVEK